MNVMFGTGPSRDHVPMTLLSEHFQDIPFILLAIPRSLFQYAALLSRYIYDCGATKSSTNSLGLLPRLNGVTDFITKAQPDALLA